MTVPAPPVQHTHDAQSRDAVKIILDALVAAAAPASAASSDQPSDANGSSSEAAALARLLEQLSDAINKLIIEIPGTDRPPLRPGQPGHVRTQTPRFPLRHGLSLINPSPLAPRPSHPLPIQPHRQTQ